MESYGGKRKNSMHITQYSEEAQNEALQARMAELAQTKEELNRARDRATQSWLDSRPLIDELEKFQSELANAKNRASMAAIVISELESELDTTNASIRSKKEVEQKARTTIEKLEQALDQTRAELEKLKLEAEEERRARAKLKKDLQLRRQTLQTLQLTHRAVRLESEAFKASAEDALLHIKHPKMDDTTVQLTHEDYYALTKRAEEETALADWRVSVSMEQRLAAKASRDEALRRLKKLYNESKSRNRNMKEDRIIEEGEGEMTKKERRENSTARKERTKIASTSARANVTSTINRGTQQQQLRRSSGNPKKKVVKKKPSILHQIRRFFVRKITRLFG